MRNLRALLMLSGVLSLSVYKPASSESVTYNYIGNNFEASPCTNTYGDGFEFGCGLPGYITASVTLNLPNSDYTGYTGSYTGAVQSFYINPHDGIGAVYSSASPVLNQSQVNALFQLNNGVIINWQFGAYTVVPNTPYASEEISTQRGFGEDTTDYDDLAPQGLLSGANYNNPGSWTLTNIVAPPTPFQLAELSGDTYNSNPNGVAGFSLLTTLNYGNGLVADVYGTKDNSQLVLAFRGTDTSQIKNLLADAALGAGANNAILNDYVTDAAQALKVLAAANPLANITLTGHSLGGSIAQLLGQATGLNTVTFDAPGMKSEYANYSSQLAALGRLGSGSENVDYRLYGDQFSLVGNQLGTVITVGSSGGPATVIDSAGIQAAHSISTLTQDLASGSSQIQTAGVIGPNFSLAINNAIIPLISNVASLTFVQLVSAYNHYYIDPGTYNTFKLTEAANSPLLNSIALPTMIGVSDYSLRWETGNSWSSYINVTPDSTVNFGSNVDGVEFAPLNASGAAVESPGVFLFDLTFSSSGTFNGTLDQYQLTSAAPEPASWVLLIVGFGFSGGWLRRRRFTTITA